MKRPALVLVLGLAACAGVLGLRRDAAAPGFPHRAHVIAGVACTTCHVGVAAATDTGPLHLPDSASCTGACHPVPHDARPCLGCHGDGFAAAGAVDARAHLRFDHGLHQAPSSGNCMRCHQGVAEGAARLRPPMAACWSCHEHDRARDVRACDACHVDLAEEGVPPASHVIHDDGFLADHGRIAASSADLCSTCHSDKTCARCHAATAPMVPARMTFGDPMRASVHRAGFRARHGDEARADPGTCTSCHAPERCAACHVAEGVAGPDRASPHPPGWVGAVGDNLHGRAARRDPLACASCHGGAGEALCVSCHQVGGVGGNPHPPGYDSRLPLSALPCRLCHQAGTAR